jgi:DNA-binding protein YbaB
MTDTPTPRRLTYEEMQALPVIKKLLKRKPEFAAELMSGMVRQGAVNVLLQAQRELKDLQIFAKAMSEAAAAIVKMDEPNNVSPTEEK